MSHEDITVSDIKILMNDSKRSYENYKNLLMSKMRIHCGNCVRQNRCWNKDFENLTWMDDDRCLNKFC